MSASIQFIKSAVVPTDYPPAKKAEIAIAGRSNAGKSSFLNAVAGGIIAKVSSTPGKTRLLNFFSVNNKYVMVDMPGYGFAARSGDEVMEWHKMIEAYLTTRETLKGLILIMDIRREWTEDEELLKKFSAQQDFPMAVVLTKADKMSRSETLNASKKMKLKSGLSDVFVTSTLKKIGHEDVENFIYKTWVVAPKASVSPSETGNDE